ncbi:ABC transporter ATP-binding protein [Acetonema longum]|uniref:Heme exporter protein CcmA n=1 Tax=Acetonema longum DSM 6540 TaxID=1009370 RepID=F7NED6_9FIRM|nr:ABC transporter ATP-binding protein [Acetonema longum]EGO65648.1 heme exporter protein CcmA [Acetonema longum DSM 6540]
MKGMECRIGIALAGIGKRYKDRELFRDLNLAVEPGDCLTVTGSNGSGKSTLLKVMAGLLKASEGKVSYSRNGQDLNRDEWFEYFGMVSPEVVMYQHLTGEENVGFFCRTRGLSVSAGEIAACCRTAGLVRAASNRVHTYSTGMKQRLKFAVLLAVNPACWILDEPSSNLDGEGRVWLRQLVHSVLSREKTVILATNEPAEVEYATKSITLG